MTSSTARLRGLMHHRLASALSPPYGKSWCCEQSLAGEQVNSSPSARAHQPEPACENLSPNPAFRSKPIGRLRLDDHMVAYHGLQATLHRSGVRQNQPQFLQSAPLRACVRHEGQQRHAWASLFQGRVDHNISQRHHDVKNGYVQTLPKTEWAQRLKSGHVDHGGQSDRQGSQQDRQERSRLPPRYLDPPDDPVQQECCQEQPKSQTCNLHSPRIPIELVL